MRYSDLYPKAPATPEERRRYGKAVSRYYARTFSMLRRLVEMAGPDTVTLIMSDHGFAEEGVRRRFSRTRSAPPGVLIAVGGGADHVDKQVKASIYDVTPTLLWLSGYPRIQTCRAGA